jgi:head-tail adaptor
MTAPRLNRRLMLESSQRLEDGSGGYNEVWVALGVLWAEVTPRTGREINDAGLTISSVSYKIVVQASPHGSLSRPRPEQRFREGSRVFLIQAVTEFDHDARYITCFADEELVA